MAHSTITLSNDNWIFILDSLIDRLENLTDINSGPYGMIGELDEDIRHCESIIAAIEKRK
jgi:hypothetical protein